MQKALEGFTSRAFYLRLIAYNLRLEYPTNTYTPTTLLIPP